MNTLLPLRLENRILTIRGLRVMIDSDWPNVFTEHGAIQAANVLASTQAIEMGIYVVRAYVQLRQADSIHADLAKRLLELETKTEGLWTSHDNFARNTRYQLRQIFDALRELTTPPEPANRPIGFITPQDKP